MNIKVRKAEEKDIDRILEIDAQCFSHPWSRDTFIDDVNDELKSVWVAELGLDEASDKYNYADTAYDTYAEKKTYSGRTVIAGYLDAFAMATVESEILRVATDRNYRRLGIAHNLINFMLCYCNLIASPKILLEVREDNAPAIALYKSFNFNEDGRRAKYYDNSVDAILMSRVVSIETRNMQLDIEDGLYD